jgi:hypothetical protein
MSRNVTSSVAPALRWVAIAVVAVFGFLICQSVIHAANSFTRANLVNNPQPAARVSTVLPGEISIDLPAEGYTCKMRGGTYVCTLPARAKAKAAR